MKNKKIPMRSCIVTKEKCEKRELIRIVKDKEENITIDLTGRLNGRGCYLKKDKEVIKKAKQTSAIDRALEIKVPDTIYEELLNNI